MVPPSSLPLHLFCGLAMAPNKAPVFVVCGGISVETAVTEAGRRRGSMKPKRSAAAGLAESLYEDLLWDCGGANVENKAIPKVPSSTTTVPPGEDFTDVFGGPPKFVTLSSQLSFKRGTVKVTDSCSNGVSIFQSFVSAVHPINCTTAFGASNGQPRLCSSQEVSGNIASLSTSAKLTKQRLMTAAESSSHICYSDSDNKIFLNRKEESVSRRDQISPIVPQEPLMGAKAAGKTMMGESSRSDGDENAKDSRRLKPIRKGFETMKENIKESSKGIGDEHEGRLASIHARMGSSSRGFQEASQKSTCSVQETERRRHNSKVKKKEDAHDFWVTIKDVQCTTEPSRFLPPSRPPPSPRLHSDANQIIRDTYDVVKSSDDCVTKYCQTSQNKCYSDSVSQSSSCAQDLRIKTTFDSSDGKDAMAMAEAKIRMVLEAREKAKRMVEKKVREKQRARQHKGIIATEGKLRKEQNGKGQTRDLDRSKVRHCEDDVDREDKEELKNRDLARQCFERATHEVRSKSAAVFQERVFKLRASHDSSDRPVEDASEDVSAKSCIHDVTADDTPKWSDTNSSPPRRFSHQAVSAEVVNEDNIFVSNKQQKDSLSSSWCYTDWKRFYEAASLGNVGSMSRIQEDLNLFPEIAGETYERRKVRWDRHCQTAERMAKALEEKKLRDLKHEKEQAERHKAGEMLDEEIKSWAAGKEGNLEALLCSLHYVLWPECGWVQVSPADLLSAEAVRKAYRRATLCVHPDKVQQKGATVAQKYIAEKIFDLLKEASAKFT